MSVSLRTGYSFRIAAGTLKEVISRLKEVSNREAAPITDRASTFGYVRWAKACKEAGLRPVFGVELAVTPQPEAKKPLMDYWTFIAKDSIRPVNDLVGLATRQFRYEPLLTYAQVRDAQGVYKIAGRRAMLEEMQPGPDTFVAAAPAASLPYLRAARRAGFPLIAAHSNLYPRAEDVGFYQVLVGKFANNQTYSQHILSDAEWREEMEEKGLTEEELEEALNNRDRVLEGSTATLPKGTLLVPEKTEHLRDTCERAAPGLGIDLSDPVYRDRLTRELDMIYAKKFEDYFYIVGDLVRWARTQMTVGPARGSSCGSLVCYLLGITAIDPLKYDLIFERFIDVNRDDLPDIDIDFSHQKRDMVFTYLGEKYGKDRIARLGTVAKFAAAAAIGETAGALNIPKWEADMVLQSLVKRSSGDARAMEALDEALQNSPAGRKLISEHPELMVATRLEGHPRHYSQHAAGVVLTDRPVAEYVAIDARTGAAHCDKKDAETLDLLKIDALGLIQLSVFEDALRLAGLPHDYLDTVPLGDPAALDILNKRKFAGVFQFNGPALKNVAQQIKFTELEDIIAVTALARPGPFASGGTYTWLKRKAGQEPITYPHPAFEPFTKQSFGVVVYQEQVMQIGRGIGDLSWEDVTDLRKAMSKSLGKEFFDKYGDRWKAGAAKKGIPEAVLNKVWDDLCAYGSWAFNRSHSVAYGIVSYWCCWFKLHYPLEFAAATLIHEADPDKQIRFLRELDEEGIKYIPVSAEKSTDKWTVDIVDGEKMLIGPVSNVKGVGPKLVAAVMSARARGEPLPDRVKKLLANPKTPLDSLFPVRDKIKELMPDPTARNIWSHPKNIGEVMEEEGDSDVLLFCTFSKIKPRDENEEILVAKRGGQRISGPTQYLGLTALDDTGQIYCKITKYKYEEIGKPIVDRGKPGKALYAVKGRAWGDATFRGVMVDVVRYIGDM